MRSKIAAAIALVLVGDGCTTVQQSGDDGVLLDEATARSAMGRESIAAALAGRSLVVEWVPNDDSFYFGFDNRIEFYCLENPLSGSRCLIYFETTAKELEVLPSSSKSMIGDAFAIISDGYVSFVGLGSGTFCANELGLFDCNVHRSRTNKRDSGKEVQLWVNQGRMASGCVR